MSAGVIPRWALLLGERGWRAWLRLRYLLFQRHRHDRLILEHVAGFPILVLPGVFNPKLFWTGELLARSLSEELVPAGAVVLDLGTGSGIGAIAAARTARRVVAVDVNRAALRCARINALLNGVEARVDVRTSDLFAGVAGERFDVVLFNPPWFPGRPRDDLDRAFRSGDLAHRFARELGRHLAPDGRALLLLSSRGETGSYLDALREAGFETEPVLRAPRIGEVLTLYSARPSAAPW